MKQSEIHVNGLYMAKVSNRLVPVRVVRIDEQAGFKSTTSGYRIKSRSVYVVMNTVTGRETRFRSAAKFRSAVAENEPGKVY